MSWRQSVDPSVLKVYAVLYTHQKHKKSKTWQDGKVKIYQNTSKAVLFDDKGFKLDSHFCKNRPVKIGEQYDFDRHLVIFDEFLTEETDDSASLFAPIQAPTVSSLQTRTLLRQTPLGSTSVTFNARPFTREAPGEQGSNPIRPTVHRVQLPSENAAISESSAAVPTPHLAALPNTLQLSPLLALPPENVPVRKRRRVGLSRAASSASRTPGTSPIMESIAQEGNSFPLPNPKLGTPTKFKSPPPSGIYFPTKESCASQKSFTVGPPMRKMKVGSRFQSLDTYRETMTLLVNEHLQVILWQLALQYHQIRLQLVACGKTAESSESLFRSRGCHLHIGCSLRSFSSSSWSHPSSALRTASRTHPTSNYVLTLGNRQRSSMYSKDDLWVISNSDEFPNGATFLARSTFYGLSSKSTVDLRCLSTRDSNIARNISEKAFAIRAVNCTSEFLMLDTLEVMLPGRIGPVIFSLVNWKPKDLTVVVRSGQFRPPRRHPAGTQCVNLPEMDKAELDVLLNKWISDFSLNADQEAVCKAFAQRTIKTSNGQNVANTELPPVLLVHGVFGAGKSYLIAVLIILLHRVMTLPNALCKERNVVLVTSLTNVAVDRILLALLDLGFRNFVRVGSVKKIAKRILPFTAQARADQSGEVNELKMMLEEENLSLSEKENVREALKRFREQESVNLLSSATVVGTTCMASNFDVFENMKFSIAILDESSQIMEPMAIVPLTRFECDFALLLGDPKQLPPTLSTPAIDASQKQGLDRTMFERAVEMNIKPVILRTQYRCHPDISAVANEMFYDGALIDGVSAEDRPPIIRGLGAICLINVVGEEEQHPLTKSFLNKREATVIVHFVRRLREIGICPAEIGIICLYKAQADVIELELKTTHQVPDAVQVSTVDAFQGAEKNIIILSCVRTRGIGFIDNSERVNVAITRSKRHLIVVGNADLMLKSALWERIINRHMKSTSGMVLSESELREQMPGFSTFPRQETEAKWTRVDPSLQQPVTGTKISHTGEKMTMDSPLIQFDRNDEAGSLLDAFDDVPDFSALRQIVSLHEPEHLPPPVARSLEDTPERIRDRAQRDAGERDGFRTADPLGGVSTAADCFVIETRARQSPPSSDDKERMAEGFQVVSPRSKGHAVYRKGIRSHQESESDEDVLDLTAHSTTLSVESELTDWATPFLPRAQTAMGRGRSQPTLDSAYRLAGNSKGALPLQSFVEAVKQLRVGPAPLTSTLSPLPKTSIRESDDLPRLQSEIVASDLTGLEGFDLDDLELSD